jgi:hypothetical protein
MPNTTSERLQWLSRFGHRWNSDFQNLLNADDAAVAKMNGDEEDAKAMVLSFQKSDANVSIIHALMHGSDPADYVADGEICPATAAVMEFKRCAMPDFPPPPNASFHYDDPDLQAMVESQQAAAAFAGPYWKGCDPQHPDIHSLVIGIDIRNAGRNFLANQEKILEARRACAAEIGVSVRYVLNPESTAGLQQLQVYRNIPGGVIGRNYFPSSNSCGKIPNGDMDSGYDPSDYRLHANLGTHEAEGHGFGFNHTFGGIMNSSIVLVWPLTWKGDPGWSQVKRYYPGEPVGPVIPPPSPAHPVISGSLSTELVGHITAIRGEVKLELAPGWSYIAVPDGFGKYKLIPKPVL